jgi:hypothetical protein
VFPDLFGPLSLLRATEAPSSALVIRRRAWIRELVSIAKTGRLQFNHGCPLNQPFIRPWHDSNLKAVQNMNIFGSQDENSGMRFETENSITENKMSINTKYKINETAVIK